MCTVTKLCRVAFLVLSQVLEYTGRGKSIIDVGLAQARSPLNTTIHYFEIEIVDPGESCYIAIGLTRRVSGDSVPTFSEMPYLVNFFFWYHLQPNINNVLFSYSEFQLSM